MSNISNTNFSKIVNKRLYWIILLVLVVWTAGPLIWSISASFKTPLEVYRLPPKLFPDSFNIESYQKVLNYTGFWRLLFNSVFLALSSTLIAVAFSVMSGYALARYKFKLRSVLLLVVLIPRILPRSSLVVPLYQMIVDLNLIDNYLSLIITYAATAVPMATWILAGFFQVIPKALEEAASVDGARPWQVVWHVILPLAKPGILTISIFSLREAWNEFPFVLSFTTSTEMRTLPYQLYMLKDSMGIQDWPMLNAFTIVTILPILILYLIFERQVVNGIVTGAVK